MKYDISYDHLKEELYDQFCVKNKSLDFEFNQLKKYADEYRLELSDEDFENLFRLHVSGKDVEWIMFKMSNYGTSFTSALVSYCITCNNY